MHIKIISGGQTGVDQAALEAAIKTNFPHGGWCPKGRIAENGDPSDENKVDDVVEWVSSNNIKMLNIGGPRESESPGINDTSLKFLMTVFQKLKLSKSA